MKKTSIIKVLSPWTIILLLVLAAVIFIPALAEYFSSKRDMLGLWHQQGQLLSETILRSADKITIFDQQSELIEKERMLDVGHYAYQIDSLNARDLRSFRQNLRRQERVHSLIFGPNGQVQKSGRNRALNDFRDKLSQYIKNENPQNTVDLLPDAIFEQPNSNAVIVKRSANRGFFVLVPARTSDKRQKVERQHLVGWMDHLTAHASIKYIVLEREGRIIASSGPLPIDFEKNLSLHPQGVIREIDHERVFEYSQLGPAGLRIILSIPAIALERLEYSLMRRLFINSAILLLLGSVLVIYLTKKQNYSFLQSRYAHIQTYNTSVLENIDEGIIVINQDKSISVINRAAQQLLQVERNKILNQEITKHPSILPEKLLLDLNAFKTIHETPVEIQRNKRNLELLITAHAAKLTGIENESQIYIILLRDNTARRELENFRSRKSKLLAMGELASRVAHEIRNPLNGIAVLAQRIQKEFNVEDPNNEFEKMTQSIRSESSRINEIIESFLYYARTPQLKLQDENLCSWLENTQPLLEAMGNVHFEPLPLEKLIVNIDQDQLKQALINLVKNGVEASTNDAPVYVSVLRSDEMALIRVEDSGTGISNELQDQVFDLYFSAKEQGSGLGLSIVEKIISAHNGQVHLESPYVKNNETKKGTRFEIRLPLSGLTA